MKRYLPVILMIVLLIGFRLAGLLLPEYVPQNFQPVAALFFCGALICNEWRGFLVPLGAWLATYWPVHLLEEPAVFATTLLAFGCMFFFGMWFRKRQAALIILGAVGSAVIFHIVTNTAAWIGSPLYAKTMGGLWQSLWSGPTGGNLPSWIFLRNMIAGNVLFTALFLLACVPLPVALTSRTPALAKPR
ncbi:MAG: DUF6580 family putative transport protein [Verrucomicrobiota bacterium]